MKRNIKRLPIVDVFRRRKSGIDDHMQGYHKNLGREYKSGDWARTHLDSAYHPDVLFVVKGVKREKVKDKDKTVYLVSKYGDDIAVLHSISHDGKSLEVHVMGESGVMWVNPDNWEVLKVSKGQLDEKLNMNEIEWIKIGEEIDSYHEKIVDYKLSDNRRVALRYNDVKDGFCYFKIAEDGRTLLELDDVEDGDEIYDICEKIEKEIRKE